MSEIVRTQAQGQPTVGGRRLRRWAFSTSIRRWRIESQESQYCGSGRPMSTSGVGLSNSQIQEQREALREIRKQQGDRRDSTASPSWDPFVSYEVSFKVRGVRVQGLEVGSSPTCGREAVEHRDKEGSSSNTAHSGAQNNVNREDEQMLHHLTFAEDALWQRYSNFQRLRAELLQWRELEISRLKKRRRQKNKGPASASQRENELIRSASRISLPILPPKTCYMSSKNMKEKRKYFFSF